MVGASVSGKEAADVPATKGMAANCFRFGFFSMVTTVYIFKYFTTSSPGKKKKKPEFVACAVFPGLNPSTTVNYQPPVWSPPTRSREGWAPPGYQCCAEPPPGRPVHSSRRVPVLPAPQLNTTSEREAIDMHILAKASNSENPELRFCMFQRASLNGRLSCSIFFFY